MTLPVLSPDRVGDFVALLAASPDARTGVERVLAHLAELLRAQIDVRSDDDVGMAPPRGRAGEPSRLAHVIPLTAFGRSAGELVILRGDSLTADERALLVSAAPLLAAALAADAQRQGLERELTARVLEIAQHQAFIERVVDSLPVALYVIDREYRIHVWNHRREIGLQGIARRDALGRTIFEVLHRQPAALLKGEFDEVFASGRLQQFQMESRAFGRTRTFRISKIPMRVGSGEVSHVITIGEDITEWKEAIDRIAQSEKLAALGQLAAGVMHEINNPLATIAACAETMALQREMDTGTPTGPGDLLHIIDLEVQRCKRIVNGLLDFSRSKPAVRQTHDLNAVVQQGMFLLQHHPKYKRVRMRTELAPHALLVEVDDDQLVQVLMALAINAMDASPEGGAVIVRTRLTPGADGEMHAALEVADEGPGIPPSLQAKVFEPFFTTKPPGQGTGLGLAICYGIVHDHGGQLELVPGDGPGATFRVALPQSPLARTLADADAPVDGALPA